MRESVLDATHLPARRVVARSIEEARVDKRRVVASNWHLLVTVYALDGKDVRIRILDSGGAELVVNVHQKLALGTHLDPLDRKALRAILTEPRNSLIRQQQKLFAMDGIKLTFTDEALEYIVDKAVEYKLGARGLRSIVEAIMITPQFELPSSGRKQFKVDLDYAKQQIEKNDTLSTAT